MTVQPYNQLPGRPQRGIPSAEYVHRHIHDQLAKLQIEVVGGGSVSSSAEGHVRIDLGGAAGADCKHPLQVYISNINGALYLSVRPGWVALEGAALVRPLLGGLPLNREPPPQVPCPFAANVPVWLDVNYTPLLGSTVIGTAPLTYLQSARMEGIPLIRVGGLPLRTLPEIDWTAGSVSSGGSTSLLLATVNDGIPTQEWYGSASAYINDTLGLTWSLGGV